MGQAADEPDVSTSAVAERPLLVGRAREQELLRGHLSRMFGGRGRLVLVSGEAGIGKTTLVEDLSVQAEEHGALVLWGHAYDFSVTPPYGPWLEVLRQYRSLKAGLPPLPAFFGNADELAKVGSQETLFAAVVDFFSAVAAQRPLVLVLDDLHWADQASLDFLRFLSRQVAGSQILLIGTYRSDELTRRHPLSSLLPLLVREAGAERLDVRPLDDVGHRALIQQRYLLADDDLLRLERYLAQRADGNPLYASELLRTLEEERILVPDRDGSWVLGDLEQVRVPPLLRQVIDGRLARLPDDTRSLLQVAAIVGQHVPVELWQRVSGAPDEVLVAAIEQGQTAQLLAEDADGATYRFRHALLREALYEDLVSLPRRSLHRRVAEALAETRNPDPDAVAYHFQQAGDVRATAWLITAGERAERAYDWATAAERFDTALAKLTEHDAPPVEQAVLLCGIARMLRYADTPRALTLMEEARRLATQAGDPALASLCLNQTGLYRCFMGDLQAGLAAIEQGIAAFFALDVADQRRASDLVARGSDFEVLEEPVAWLAMTGRLAEAYARGTRMVAEGSMPELRPDRGTAGSSYDALAGLAWAEAMLGRPEEARRTYQQARAAYQAIGHHTLAASTGGAELNLVRLTYYPEEIESRRQLLAESEAAGRRAQGATGGVLGVYPSLHLLCVEGAWAEAYAVGTRAFGSTSWLSRVTAAPWLAALARDQGDIDVAWQVIAGLLPDGPGAEPGNNLFRATVLLQRLAAEIALDAHDLPTARAWIEAHDRWLEWSGAVLGRAEGALLRARYHHADGAPQLARQQAEQALAQASDPRQPLALIAVHRYLGRLDREAGEYAAAADHLGESLRLADACAAPFEQALTLLELARLHAKQQRTEDARRLLAEVRAICEPLEARPTLQQVTELEAELSATPRPSYPAGLTAREVEVLRLVAEDLSDAEVAERLYLSPRTVSQHLRSIYNKLGVNSRGAAIRFAVEQGLV